MTPEIPPNLRAPLNKSVGLRVDTRVLHISTAVGDDADITRGLNQAGPFSRGGLGADAEELSAAASECDHFFHEVAGEYVAVVSLQIVPTANPVAGVVEADLFGQMTNRSSGDQIMSKPNSFSGRISPSRVVTLKSSSTTTSCRVSFSLADPTAARGGWGQIEKWRGARLVRREIPNEAAFPTKVTDEESAVTRQHSAGAATRGDGVFGGGDFLCLADQKEAARNANLRDLLGGIVRVNAEDNRIRCVRPSEFDNLVLRGSATRCTSVPNKCPSESASPPSRVNSELANACVQQSGTSTSRARRARFEVGNAHIAATHIGDESSVGGNDRNRPEVHDEFFIKDGRRRREWTAAARRILRPCRGEKHDRRDGTTSPASHRSCLLPDGDRRHRQGKQRRSRTGHQPVAAIREDDREVGSAVLGSVDWREGPRVAVAIDQMVVYARRLVVWSLARRRQHSCRQARRSSVGKSCLFDSFRSEIPRLVRKNLFRSPLSAGCTAM